VAEEIRREKEACYRAVGCFRRNRLHRRCSASVRLFRSERALFLSRGLYVSIKKNPPLSKGISKSNVQSGADG
jgi:hypothetical protein